MVVLAIAVLVLMFISPYVLRIWRFVRVIRGERDAVRLVNGLRDGKTASDED